ncbi:MAG: 4-alpha-glucanotransferase [Caldilineae bacterium]|nr:MAG: 4-alpha-glucanotransferase [Caldilineae bacterium]
MMFQRQAGILLHPTSLPSPFGIGDLGQEAYHFVDWLAGARQRLWQVLPLGPTGYGDSPYQCFSAFAGNPLLIDLRDLVERGYIMLEDLAVPPFPRERVDYGPVILWKREILAQAFNQFQTAAPPDAYCSFVEQESGWLQDYALFMALKDEHGGRPWPEWDPALRDRDSQALARARERLSERIRFHCFQQWIFFEQWLALKRYANQRGIRIIGDIPIYVAMDSADAWSQREMFHFDEEGRPTVVAGVPPDYFSPTGQLWGNPIYRWDRMAADGYAWWIERFKANLRLYDVIRVDHFRGFYNYWQVPGGAATAVDGQWVDGPRQHFFDTVIGALGELPLIAEDLGEPDPGVYALRDHYGFPGMKVLQFAWSSDGYDPFLPHNYPKNCVVYTGTHDNDTTRGWYEKAPERERDFVRRYLRVDGHDIAWDMIRLALMSVADLAIVPLQDCMNLGSEARMNTPAQPSGNWAWRFLPDQLTEGIQAGLAEMCELYGRIYVPPEQRRRSAHAL